MGPTLLNTPKVMKVTVGSPMVAMLLTTVLFCGSLANAQSKQYQRKSSTPAEAPVGAVIPPKAGTAAGTKDAKADNANSPTTPKQEGDKLDISELEQKYWAPKDTDFSVVQNRTYTKADRFALTLSYGPKVNDLYSEGYNTGVALNYYFDERSGVEFQYLSSNLKNSDSTNEFLTGIGGGSAPDFNRATKFYGVGYNWVPFYAKMSFLGKKIIYFDMQFTPIIGMESYEQQDKVGKGKEKSTFAYGIDVTQYYFFHKDFAVRLNLHNTWSKQEELYYVTGKSTGKDSYSTTMFMFGLTWFLK